MKPIRLTILGILTPLLLGCSSSSSAYPLDLPAEDYITTLEVSDIDDFTICVFNDLHISVLSNLTEEIAYYEKCLTSNGGAIPSLIVLNGDVFMGAAKSQIEHFFDWIDSKGIPFAYVYGNHDLEGTYSNLFIDQVVKSCEHSVLLNPLNDNVFGDSNYVLNIKEIGTPSTLKWQLYFYDSNTYYGVDYDVIHDDQIAWYEKQQIALGGNDVPSLTFMHIPTEEFEEAYDIIGKNVTSGYDGANTESLWYMGESISWGYKETDFYETMQVHGNNKAIISAHDHVNLTDWQYDKDEGSVDNMMHLIYGLKTGRGIYHDQRIMGASFYTLKDSNEFDIKWMNVPYEGSTFEITPEYLVGLGEGAIA